LTDARWNQFNAVCSKYDGEGAYDRFTIQWDTTAAAALAGWFSPLYCPVVSVAPLRQAARPSATTISAAIFLMG
jgi:hypothetical protein